MSLRLRILCTTLASAAILSAGAARADDTWYAAHDAAFASTLDGSAIITPDVTYPGPHASVVARLPARTAGALAFDDVTYPVADESAPAAAPARAPARSAHERLACDCGRR